MSVHISKHRRTLLREVRRSRRLLPGMITFLCLALALLVPLQHMAIAAYADDLEEMQRREELYLKAMKEIGTILQMDLSERKAIAEAHDIIERNEDGLMAAPARIRMIVYKNETFRRAVIQRIEEQGVEEFWREINESPRSVTELRGSEEVARSIEETLRRQAETLRRVADRLHRATLNSEQGYLGQPGSGANFGQVVLQQSVAALRSLGTLSCRAVEAGLSAVVTTAAAVEHPVRLRRCGRRDSSQQVQSWVPPSTPRWRQRPNRQATYPSTPSR